MTLVHSIVSCDVRFSCFAPYPFVQLCAIQQHILCSVMLSRAGNLDCAWNHVGTKLCKCTLRIIYPPLLKRNVKTFPKRRVRQTFSSPPKQKHILNIRKYYQNFCGLYASGRPSLQRKYGQLIAFLYKAFYTVETNLTTISHSKDNL